MGGPDSFLGIELADRVSLLFHSGEELVDQQAVGARRRECTKIRERPLRSGSGSLLPSKLTRALKPSVGTDTDRNSLGDVFPNS
jgi:hypothetical protein